jgi:hypothetical protein
VSGDIDLWLKQEASYPFFCNGCCDYSRRVTARHEHVKPPTRHPALHREDAAQPARAPPPTPRAPSSFFAAVADLHGGAGPLPAAAVSVAASRRQPSTCCCSKPSRPAMLLPPARKSRVPSEAVDFGGATAAVTRGRVGGRRRRRRGARRSARAPAGHRAL